MAGAIGGSAGYLTVDPTRNYIGEAAKGVEETATRFRAEKLQKERQRIEDERYQQEQRRKDFSEAREFSEKYPFIATGTGLDAGKRQTLINYKNAYSENQDKYIKTGDTKYKAIADNILNGIGKVNEMPIALKAKAEELIKNEKNYNPKSLAKVKGVLEQMANGNLNETIDENGNSKFTLVGKDDDGNISKLIFKDINSKQLMGVLNPKAKFDVSGEKGFVDRYQKTVGKEIEEKKIVGNKEVTTKRSPGAEEVSLSLAKEAVEDENALYDTFEKMGIDAENKANYTPENKQKAITYLADFLKSTTPTTTSEKSDYEGANFKLSKQKEANDERQRAIDNARKDREEKQKQKESRAKETKIGSAKVVDKEGYTVNGVKVEKGDKPIAVSDKGIKNTSGFKNTLKEVVVHKDGTLTYSFEQDNPEDWVMTVEGKAKVAADPTYKPTTSDYIPQKPRKANYKTGGKGAKANEVEAGILNITNPETGDFFTSTTESDEFFRRKAGVEKVTTKTVKKIQKPQSRPKQVVQNGVTYTWNEVKQTYE